MSTVCPTEVHEAAKLDPDRIRAEWRFRGVWDHGFALHEIFDCPCGSSIMLEGVGPCTL